MGQGGGTTGKRKHEATAQGREPLAKHVAAAAGSQRGPGAPPVPLVGPNVMQDRAWEFLIRNELLGGYLEGQDLGKLSQCCRGLKDASKWTQYLRGCWAGNLPALIAQGGVSLSQALRPGRGLYGH